MNHPYIRTKLAISFLCGVGSTLLVVWWLRNAEVVRENAPIRTQGAGGVSEELQKKGNQPLIATGRFQSPYFSIEDQLTDNFLNSLVRGRKTREVLNVMFGAPISVTTTGDLMRVDYNLAVYDEKIRKRGGRVGFSAVFKDGVIVEWTPISQY